MFDLDHAVAAWRRTLEHRRAFSGEDLDEIEEHVRDHVDALAAQGVDPAEAFERAVARFGGQDDVEAEYLKVFWIKRKLDGRIVLALRRDAAILRSFLKMAVRSIRKAKGHAFINIFGMAVGLACCLFILLYIHDEWRHDRFHEKSDRIYRLTTQVYEAEQGPGDDWALSSRLAADHLLTDYPHVEDVVRLRKWNPQVVHEGRYYDDDDVLFAGASFFDVFSFELLDGDKTTALEQPYSVVLTESTKRRYFGSEQALGRSLVLNDSLTATVTGVAADPPSCSHFTFDALISYATSLALYPTDPFNWINFDANYTYVAVDERADPAALEASISRLPMEQFGDRLEQFGYVSTLSLTPLERIYLYSNAVQEIGRTGSAAQLRMVGIIGLFVLAIVGINFVNLSTARSVERAREVGIRKVVGSQRSLLMAQFVCEAVLVSFIGLLLAAVIVVFAMPFFNNLADKTLSLGDVFSPASVATAFVLTLLLGLLAGAYPAFVLSRFKPAAVLKGPFHQSRHGIRLRQALVVVQFALSIGLVVGTLVVHQQLQYMQAQRLGFDKEQVLVLDVPESELSSRPDVIRQRLADVPGVRSVASSELVPGHRIGHGIVYVGDQPTGPPIEMNVGAVDERYVETMGLEVRAGRSFSPAYSTDCCAAAMINEKAAARFGYATAEEAVGTVVVEASDMTALTIIGVLRDYHHESLREAIPPTLVRVKPSWYEFASLRLEPGDVAGTVNRVEQAWAELFPGHAFDYFFLDDAFDRQYAAERRLMTVFGVFAGLAIFIACLGLVGLASSMAAQRTKEIGVRKVLGASTTDIVALLTKGIAWLVLIAVALGGPVSFLAMDGWLADFAYRIDLSWLTVVMAGAAALCIALLTVSYHAVRAAVANPVKALRYE